MYTAVLMQESSVFKCMVLKLLFRKTMATRYKQMGLSIEEIAKILGHKSIKTTEQFYLSIMDNDIRNIVQKCH